MVRILRKENPNKPEVIDIVDTFSGIRPLIEDYKDEKRPPRKYSYYW